MVELAALRAHPVHFQRPVIVLVVHLGFPAAAYPAGLPLDLPPLDVDVGVGTRVGPPARFADEAQAVLACVRCVALEAPSTTLPPR